MELDLWSDFKEYYSANPIKVVIDRNTEDEGNLSKLIEVKLQEISFAINRSCANKPNLIIAESCPLNFLAAFLAGVIKGANVFLCDPDWQQQEWQQVLNLIEPDLVFAEQQIKDSILNRKGINTNKIELEFN